MNYEELVKALRCCENDLCRSCSYESGRDFRCMNRMASDAAAAIEALQAQLPKRGEWFEENIRPRSSQFVCSECHGKAYYPQPTRDKMWTKRCGYAYCPHCGADMRAKMEVQE